MSLPIRGTVVKVTLTETYVMGPEIDPETRLPRSESSLPKLRTFIGHVINAPYSRVSLVLDVNNAVLLGVVEHGGIVNLATQAGPSGLRLVSTWRADSPVSRNATAFASGLIGRTTAGEQGDESTASEVGTASANSCSFTGDYGSCAFSCAAGVVITLTANDPSGQPGRYPKTSAICGGTSGYCQSEGSCSTIIGPTTASGQGTCWSDTISNSGSCSAGALPTPPPSGSDSCSFTGNYAECSFVCEAGHVLRLTAYDPAPDRYPRTSVTCGGVSAYCQAANLCELETEPASYSANGVCRSETIANIGSCASLPPSKVEKVCVAVDGPLQAAGTNWQQRVIGAIGHMSQMWYRQTRIELQAQCWFQTGQDWGSNANTQLQNYENWVASLGLEDCAIGHTHVLFVNAALNSGNAASPVSGLANQGFNFCTRKASAVVQGTNYWYQYWYNPNNVNELAAVTGQELGHVNGDGFHRSDQRYEPSWGRTSYNIMGENQFTSDNAMWFTEGLPGQTSNTATLIRSFALPML